MMFGGGQHCVDVRRLKWRWWVDEAGCHCTLLSASWRYKTPGSVPRRRRRLEQMFVSRDKTKGIFYSLENVRSKSDTEHTPGVIGEETNRKY